MNISKEILNTIDGLAERFGVVIDWSKDNVYPQVADICERLIHYKLVCQWIWFAVFAMILVTGIALLVTMIKDRREIVEKVELAKISGQDKNIKSKCRLYHCNRHFLWYKETNGYSTDEIDITLLGELSIVGIFCCFIAGVIGVICSLATLIKLYIIPEVVIINYIQLALS